MKFESNMYGAPPESASRKLDNFVAGFEMPYGYENSPPAFVQPKAVKEQEFRSKSSRKGK